MTYLQRLKCAAVALLLFPATHAFSEPPQIGPGDKLRIAVLGGGIEAQVLSGDFKVGADGSIEYPLLGQVPVAGKQPNDVGRGIQSALGDNVKLAIAPLVSISEFAPVYLLGNVSKPGAYPYQPDLTVFQLVLATGGLPSASGKEGEAQLRAALQEKADQELNRYALQVERARLLAQIKDTDFSPRSIARPQQAQAAAIVANEIDGYAAWKRSRLSQKKSYDAQLATFDREIQSLRKSIDLHDDEVKLLEDEMKTQIGLSEKGLIARVKVSEIKREYIILQRQALDFRTALYRAEQNRLNTEQRLIDARANADATSWDRLRNIEIDIGRADIRLGKSAQDIAEMERDKSTLKDTLGRTPIYTLLRPKDGAFVISRADEKTKLLRGDILKVELDAVAGLNSIP